MILLCIICIYQKKIKNKILKYKDQIKKFQTLM